MDELEARVVLVNTPGLGPVRIRELLERHDSAVSALREVTGWEQNETWRRDLQLVEEQGVRLITDEMAGLLYVKGEMPTAPGIAIVGTRGCTLYGREMAGRLSRDLGASGMAIISGLARGIDTAAHRAAVEGGYPPVAIIGSGLANLYPRENIGLASQLTLVSEFPMMTPPSRTTFPKRNRLISAMSEGVVVVESPLKGGSMITASRAREQGKPLYALPGRADSPTFAGNHSLIKQGLAKLIESAADITGQRVAVQGELPLLSEAEAKVVHAMPAEEVSVDQIADLSGVPMAQLTSLLMKLVFKKAVKSYPGSLYRKIVS